MGLEHFADRWALCRSYHTVWPQWKKTFVYSFETDLLSTSKETSSLFIASSHYILSMPLLQAPLYQPPNWPSSLTSRPRPIAPPQPESFFQTADLQWLPMVSRKKSRKLSLTFRILQIWLVFNLILYFSYICLLCANHIEFLFHIELLDICFFLFVPYCFKPLSYCSGYFL